MRYAYQLRSHANARYQDSLISLSQKELACMLSACGVDAQITPCTLGGAPFLCFEADPLTPAQTAFVHGHSALYMTAALEGDLLRPLDPPAIPCLPGDMPDILKYKGKTNAAFTHLLINLALSAGGVWQQPHPRVLDPICGRGTTLYCALTRGMHAVGVEESRRELSEGIAFTQKWLQYHRVKHSMTRAGMTLPGGKNAPGTLFTVQTDTGALTMTMIQADTSQCGQLLRKQRVHALAADLPYGVQHAPTEGRRISSLEQLLERALPAWYQALLPGCAAAVAFNTYTLRRDRFADIAQKASFEIAGAPLYDNFEHWVEQAVNRDVLVLLRPAKDA